MEKHILSKSTFMAGHQCLKRLYFHKYRSDLRDELDAATEARFAAGTNIGVLAQQLYPGGVDCTPESYYDWRPSIQRTAGLIANGQKVIYEAAFQFERVMAAIDILVHKEDGWHAYEVKSSTEVKDYHIMDGSLQYWVIQNSGLDLRSIQIVHINNQYVRDGELDIPALFTTEDITEYVLPNQAYIAEQVAVEKQLLKDKTEPDIEIGSHCGNPFTCDFMGHCWQHIPDYSVFDLVRGGKRAWDLYEQGILEIADIPEDYGLAPTQIKQVEGERNGTVQINREGIRSFLDDLEYPLYYLDFETFNPALPVFDGTRPYQKICFQYSIHVQQEPGSETEHFEYLGATDGTDSRPGLIQGLIEHLGSTGDIIVYNQGFESSVLNSLGADFPEYESELQVFRSRIVDLMVPFQRGDYYTPEMRGRYSIKVVLPALVPDLSYDGLEIADGGTASLAFESMVAGAFEGDVKQVREELLRYCELDTWAMVRLVGVLEGI